MDPVLVYDGRCGLCAFAQRLVAAADLRRRIRAVPLQDPESARVLAEMPEERRWSSFHFVQDGRAAGRGAGVIALLGALPLGGGIPRLAEEAPAVRAASERLYTVAHRIRDALACAV